MDAWRAAQEKGIPLYRSKLRTISAWLKAHVRNSGITYDTDNIFVPPLPCDAICHFLAAKINEYGRDEILGTAENPLSLDEDEEGEGEE
jgi:hypothetical protein